MSKITHQHSYTFPDTGESVTVYLSDTSEGFKFALSLSHKETEETLEKVWYGLYEGIVQIQSKVNPMIWYMWLTAYWDGGKKNIPVERVVMVKDCNAEHYECKDNE